MNKKYSYNDINKIVFILKKVLGKKNFKYNIIILSYFIILLFYYLISLFYLIIIKIFSYLKTKK